MGKNGEIQTLVDPYYEALDEHEYEVLRELLHPEFAHYRPDRTINGRQEFVHFMREGRPRKDTRHHIEAVYRETDGGLSVAARGQLVTGEDERLFGFVDVFETTEGRIGSIHTFTR